MTNIKQPGDTEMNERNNPDPEHKSVLIISYHFDFHAAAIEWGLKQRGVLTHYWVTSDLPARQSVTSKISNSHESTCISGTNIEIDFAGVTAVWFRRMEEPIVHGVVDERDAGYAKKQNLIQLNSIISTLTEQVFSVNPLSAARAIDRKTTQLSLARKVGFNIPTTIVSNDPARIEDFFHEEEDIIFKPLSFMSWMDRDNIYSAATVKVNEQNLRDTAALASCPGIFQARIEKKYELRVQVIGKSFFAARLNTQEVGESIDWRFDFNGNPPAVAFDLPIETKRICLDFMRQANLTFGVFDFIVAPNNEIYFLEINEMGQFLWIEDAIPEFKLLDAFVNLLISSDPDYEHTESNCSLSLNAFREYLNMHRDLYSELQRKHPRIDDLMQIAEQETLDV